jgi:TatA/E family protein of Tat protein translocase
MLANLSGWHLIIILAVVLLLFGATRLPALSKSVAQSIRIFRNETRSMVDGDMAETTEGKAVDGNGTADHVVTHTKA